MEYNEFKIRYEAQLSIGKIIDDVFEFELNTTVTYLIKAAEKICPLKNLDDAHWLINPISTDKAWELYLTKSDKP